MFNKIHGFVIAFSFACVAYGCAVPPDGLVRAVDQGVVVGDISDGLSSDSSVDVEIEALDGDQIDGLDGDAQSKDELSLEETDIGHDAELKSDMDVPGEPDDPSTDLIEDPPKDAVTDPGVSDEGADLPEVDTTTGADLPKVDTTTGPDPGDSCCYENGGPGCADLVCANLICEVDLLCCLVEWGQSCAQTASLICGGCNLTGSGACCIDNGSPNCENFGCMNTVCQEDPYCCNTKWDSLCANKANDLCSECDMSDAGDCCASNGDPYCEKLSCVQAVCLKDDYCCTGKWDTYCADCASGGTTYNGQPCADVVDSCGCNVPVTIENGDIAEHWAPVWYQDTDDTDAQADYITAFDFDGDIISQNNWENLHTEAADLSAVIYWSLVETETHWFVLYVDFHPRDWTEDCDPVIPFLSSPCHENDMEGAMVVVVKDGSDWGKFQALYTEAHDDLHIFTNDAGITAASSPNLESAPVSFEDGSHPELYVESKGHGVCALLYDGDSHCEHPVTPGQNYFPGGDGIVYRFKGVAEVPSGGNDQDVGYALEPLESTLWPLRFNICDDGCTFDGNLNYMGVNFGKAFDGETWKDDAANPPWAWDDPDDGDLVQRGDFFFRPAQTYIQHVQGQGEVSEIYLYNPYLSSILDLAPF